MDKKTLIIYYSRSGKSEIIAKSLQTKLACDIDALGYAGKDYVAFGAAAMESLRKLTADIKGDVHKPEDYDGVIFVTPIWGSALSTPIRSYMVKYKKIIKSYSLIGVCGKAGLSGTIKDAVAVMEKEPVVSAQYLSSRIAKGDYDLEKFTSE